MLSQDDYEEFHRIIRDKMQSSDDFEISTTDNFEKSEKYQVEVTEVLVKNLKSNITVNYLSRFRLLLAAEIRKGPGKGTIQINDS